MNVFFLFFRKRSELPPYWVHFPKNYAYGQFPFILVNFLAIFSLSVCGSKEKDPMNFFHRI